MRIQRAIARGLNRTSARAGLGVGIVLLGWGVASRWSYSYDAAGHFYTAVTIQHANEPPFSGPPLNQAVLLSFCAQLPDLANEYDAVSLRVPLIASLRGSLWGAFSACWGDAVCHMVTAHHYLHGLTDTRAESVTEAAVATLRSLRDAIVQERGADPNTVCAAGFAIHLLADSFAHRRLSSPNWMYAPGMGHYSDDHNPDFVLYNKDGKNRIHLWSTFIQKLSGALNATPGQKQIAALDAILKQNLKGAALANLFHEPEIVVALMGTLKGASGDHTQLWAPYKPAVEKSTAEDSRLRQIVLKRSCQDVLNEYKISGLDCKKIWEKYRDVAVKEFNGQGIPAVCRPL